MTHMTSPIEKKCTLLLFIYVQLTPFFFISSSVSFIVLLKYFLYYVTMRFMIQLGYKNTFLSLAGSWM